MASAFYCEPTSSRRSALTSYYRGLEHVPAAGPTSPASVDAATYSILLDRIEQLRPSSFLRPPPANWSDFESAVATQSVLEKQVEGGVDGIKKEIADPMEMSSALHSTLDDIQQILSAGPSSSHDHTHLDEQALGEITAFLQSGPPVVWPENDAVRLTNVGNILPVTSVGVVEQNAAAVSNASPPVSVVSCGIDQRLEKPAEKLPTEWCSQSANASVTGSASAVICMKRYQCVLCLTAFDVPPSAPRHSGHCGVCSEDVVETPVYQCQRCNVSYYSESAAHHHALFLCTRNDMGDEIGHMLRHYRCPVCHVAFFSLAGLQSHTASLHSDLHSAVSPICAAVVSKPDNNFHQSEVSPKQSEVVQAPTPIHSPFYMSTTADSSPGSVAEASLPYRVGLPSEANAVVGEMSQTKPRARRRYSGRPPKGIVYKNVFMTSEGLYYCSTCNTDLNTVERRTEHRSHPCGRASAASYARHYVFICPHCSSRWSSQKACYEHQIATCLPQIGVSVADLSLRRYACPVCSRLHFSLAPLRGHMTTAHRLNRDEVIQHLIAAGYMTPEGSNVKFSNVVDVQKTGTGKPSKTTCTSPPSAITEAEVIAMLNKELNAVLNERQCGGYDPSSADRKSAADTADSAKKSDSAPSKLSVLAAFPQLPKPVLNLRAIPKIMATSLSNTVTLSSTSRPCISSPHTSIPISTTAVTKPDVNDKFYNGEAKLQLSISKSSERNSSNFDHAVTSASSVLNAEKELSTFVKSDDGNTGDVLSEECKCETSENVAIVTPPSTAVSLECDTTSSITTEMEKQSNSCSDAVPVRNGKLKFIFNKSDVTGNSGHQIQVPVVALERTTLTEITPTVSLSATSQGLKPRQCEHKSVYFSSTDAIATRHSFSRQRITNLRKSSTVCGKWKSSVPVLRVPINRPRTRASHGFSRKHSVTHGSRLVKQKPQKSKCSGSKDFEFDHFKGQHAKVQSRHHHQQFAAVSSGADTAAVSTRSQCCQIIKHNAVR